VPVLVDPKGTNFSMYRGATIITPNRSEFEAVVGKCSDDKQLADKAVQLIISLELQAVLVTLSERGMLLIYRQDINSDCKSIYYPAQAQEVFDVTGAGDTVIASLAAGIASGESLPAAVNLANLAASLVVAKSGSAVVELQQLRQKMTQEKHVPLNLGVLSQADLVNEVSKARAAGEKIVMTNGCFDILHAGHISYLEQASNLGDRLIVAINDDAGIRAIKGDKRPIFPLEQRLIMLAALKSVSWVVSFSQATPERLLSAIKPDILVKGGDYADISQVVGADIVKDYGGQIKLMQHVSGCSTSKVLDKLLAK
jgi:D-beta-D-heptose 7-phosphate kinase/D-beta-D-heptose 1-phosphate adenosyltransferase